MDTSAMDTSVFDDTIHVIQFLMEPANKNKTLWDCLIDGTALSEMIDDIAFQKVEVPPGILSINVERTLARYIFEHRYGSTVRDSPQRISPRVKSLIQSLFPIFLSILGSSKNDEHIKIIQKCRSVPSPSITHLLDEINSHISPSIIGGHNSGRQSASPLFNFKSPERCSFEVPPLRITRREPSRESSHIGDSQSLLDAQLNERESSLAQVHDANDDIMKPQLPGDICGLEIDHGGEDSGIGGIQSSITNTPAAAVTLGTSIQESDIEARNKAIPFTPDNTEPAELPDIPSDLDISDTGSYPSWTKSPETRKQVQQVEGGGRRLRMLTFGSKLPNADYYGSGASSEAFSEHSSPSPPPSVWRAKSNREQQLPGPTPKQTERVTTPKKMSLRKSHIRRSLPRSCKNTQQWKGNSTQTPSLAGTGLAAQPKRRPKQSAKQSVSKVSTAGRKSISIQDKVRLSFQMFYPEIVPFLEHHPKVRVVKYSEFNPFRANSTKGAVLSERKLKTVGKLVDVIMERLPRSIDDSQLGDILDRGFGLDKLTSKPGQTLEDVSHTICLEKRRSKEIRNLLDFFLLSVIRVRQSLLCDGEEFRKLRNEYDSDVMNVYLCFWGWLARLGPAYNGRQLSLVMCLLKPEVGIDRLKKCLSPNQRPEAFDMLLRRLCNLSFADSCTASCAQYVTALGYMKRLLRGTKGPNGVIITEEIIVNALMWISPAEFSIRYPQARNPTGSTHIPSTVPPPQYLGSLLLKRRLEPQSRKRHHDEGVAITGSEHDDGSPAKRTRWKGDSDSGFYGSSGRSSTRTRANNARRLALSEEVESLAKYMEDRQSMVDIVATIVIPTTCGPESIRRLKPDQPFDPPLVDAIVSMVKPTQSDLQPIYLGVEIYSEICKTEEAGFGRTKSLVRDIPRCRQWILGIVENNHFGAVSIDHQGKIGYYDPNGLRAKAQREKVTNRIKRWIEHLYDGNACKVWDVVWRFGPLQDKGDTVNCGVFTTLTICRWLYGREVDEQLGDPIKFRKEFVAQVSRRLKWNGLKMTQG